MNEEYKIVLCKDLKVGDIIIWNGKRAVLTEVSPGSGAGSVDFGEYIILSYMYSTPYGYNKHEKSWGYQNLPVILDKSGRTEL
jgi:hypothetical protein